MVSRIAVDSSSLSSIGYSVEERVLEAEFRSGSSYRFFMVPESVWNELLAAKSKGAFFNQRIKDAFPMKEIPFVEPDVDLSGVLQASISAASRGPAK